LAAWPAPASAPAQPAPAGERIGVVTHYYNHLSVALVRLESGRLRIGDMILIRGHTSDFTQRVESLHLEHKPVTEVGPNDDFALKVIAHAREHDVVYKLAP
jgi:translation elongation factor EF-1alpha